MKLFRIKWIAMLMMSMLTEIRREDGKKKTELLLGLVIQQEKMNVRERLRERETEKITIEHRLREIVPKQDLTEILPAMNVVMIVRELLRSVEIKKLPVVCLAIISS